MSSVALCCMPLGLADWPHLGLGLLKAGLARAGMGCDVRYFSIDFARRVGRSFYASIAEDGPPCYPALTGEWIFASALFGADHVDAAGYLRWTQELDPEFFSAEVQGQVLDAQAQVQPFLEACLQHLECGAYDAVGFSSSLQQQNASLAPAKRVKERWPEVTIIFGGNNVEGEMGLELLCRFHFVDYVCRGEGDALLPEFVHRLQAGESLEELPGLAQRKNGRVRATDPAADTFVPLDSLPYPDYDEFFQQYVAVFRGFAWRGDLPLETSRGCWWGQHAQCAFCGHHTDGLCYRRKSAQRALDEMEHLAERYEPRVLFLADMVAPRSLGSLFSMLERREPRLRLVYELRAGVSKSQLAHMKRAGVGIMLIGIESLSTRILQLMRKGTTALTNIQTLKRCQELGIVINWILLHGFPKEDSLEYRRMANLMPALTHLQPPRAVTPVKLLRFSPCLDQRERFGFVNVRPCAVYAWAYPSLPEASLRNLARYVDFDYADGRDPNAYVAPAEQAVAAWRDAAGTSILAYVDDGRRVRLFDTRPAGRDQVRVLTRLQRQVYLACDKQQGVKQLGRRFPNSEPPGLQRALDRMVEERLMVAEGQNYLSLAVDIGRHLTLELRGLASDDVCIALAQGLMSTRAVTER